VPFKELAVFITMVTTAHYRTLSWVSWIHFPPSPSAGRIALPSIGKYFPKFRSKRHD